MRTVSVTGERVLLRLSDARDAAGILEFHKTNVEHFRNTEPPRPSDFLTVEYWGKRIEEARQDFEADRSCQLLVCLKTAPERPVGYVNLANFVRGAFHACHMGYGIAADVQGQGLMTEAVRLVVDFAFRELNMHRVMANYIPSNERSGHLLRRLGFSVEGYARDYLFIAGRWRDHVLTAKTNPTWRMTDDAMRAAAAFGQT